MTIRKVDLNMTEEEKYQAIKKLTETNGNKNRAAINLECSIRHVNRMIQGYIREGKAYFIHGNKGRKPSHSIDLDTKQLILDLYRTKYWGANFTHYSELLGKHESINISPSAVNSILMQEYILSPKANRITKKRIKQQLEEQKESATSKKEVAKIIENILAIEDAHPRRPRCAYAGEMIQMDASLHNWFGSDKSQLHIAVDDATGSILTTRKHLMDITIYLTRYLKTMEFLTCFLLIDVLFSNTNKKNPLRWKRILLLNSVTPASS
jgi:transposase